MKNSPKASGPLGPEAEEALLLGLDPIDLPAARSATLKRRIMERAEVSASALVTIHASDGAWQEIAQNVHVKRLMHNDTFVADLFRMGPNTSLEGHQHENDEECICLEGEVWLGDVVVRAGDFHFAPKGVPHGAIRSTTGCLLYVRSGR